MRIGFNPNKDKLLQESDFVHQVILPVHIPDQQGYFKDSFEILRLCLESLFKTCHPKTFLTVVNNGSCTEVADYLDNLFKNGRLNEVIHTTAIGKLNAILKGLAGHNFRLVTVSDADVLFVTNWQKATYEIFEVFPKAGVVSPVPNSKNLRYYTSGVITGTFFSKNARFENVADPDSMRAFASSIGNPDLFKKVHLEKILVVKNADATAVVGAGHFVATYRSECFADYKQRFSKYSLGGDSEQLLLDKPASRLGLWRLSTYRNFAFHMGNVTEDWMYEKVNEANFGASVSEIKPATGTYAGIWNYFADFFCRIIFKKPIWPLYLRLKGLNAHQANEY